MPGGRTDVYTRERVATMDRSNKGRSSIKRAEAEWFKKSYREHWKRVVNRVCEQFGREKGKSGSYKLMVPWYGKREAVEPLIREVADRIGGSWYPRDNDYGSVIVTLDEVDIAIGGYINEVCYSFTVHGIYQPPQHPGCFCD